MIELSVKKTQSNCDSFAKSTRRREAVAHKTRFVQRLQKKDNNSE